MKSHIIIALLLFLSLSALFASELIIGQMTVTFCTVSAVTADVGTNTVVLKWDASPDPDAVGYKIYLGITSHNYTASVDVGNATNATITLPSHGTWYFAATCYDGAGNESDFSNETSWTTP